MLKLDDLTDPELQFVCVLVTAIKLNHGGASLPTTCELCQSMSDQLNQLLEVTEDSRLDRIMDLAESMQALPPPPPMFVKFDGGGPWVSI